MHHASLSADRQRTIGENLPSRAIVLRGRTPLGAFSYPFATMYLVENYRTGVTWCHLSLRCSGHGNS